MCLASVSELQLFPERALDDRIEHALLYILRPNAGLIKSFAPTIPLYNKKHFSIALLVFLNYCSASIDQRPSHIYETWLVRTEQDTALLLEASLTAGITTYVSPNRLLARWQHRNTR